jgi:hypothetical protein
MHSDDDVVDIESDDDAVPGENTQAFSRFMSYNTRSVEEEKPAAGDTPTLQRPDPPPLDCGRFSESDSGCFPALSPASVSVPMTPPVPPPMTAGGQISDASNHSLASNRSSTSSTHTDSGHETSSTTQTTETGTRADNAPADAKDATAADTPKATSKNASSLEYPMLERYPTRRLVAGTTTVPTSVQVQVQTQTPAQMQVQATAGSNEAEITQDDEMAMQMTVKNLDTGELLVLDDPDGSGSCSDVNVCRAVGGVAAGAASGGASAVVVVAAEGAERRCVSSGSNKIGRSSLDVGTKVAAWLFGEGWTDETREKTECSKPP